MGCETGKMVKIGKAGSEARDRELDGILTIVRL